MPLAQNTWGNEVVRAGLAESREPGYWVNFLVSLLLPAAAE